MRQTGTLREQNIRADMENLNAARLATQEKRAFFEHSTGAPFPIKPINTLLTISGQDMREKPAISKLKTLVRQPAIIRVEERGKSFHRRH